ncbi:Uncharacterised protein [Candidatus Anstonella stagnisolia]|nr:Uncharacterised protein [Candidatus Anstonella stagnisolia]
MGKIGLALGLFAFVSMCAALFASGGGNGGEVVYRPNLVLSGADPLVDPAQAYAGEYVAVSVVVADEGAPTNAWSRVVATPSGNPNIEAQSLEIAPMQPGDSSINSFRFPCPNVQQETEYTVNIVLDPDNRVQETDENDNSMQARFTCKVLPNLVFDGIAAAQAQVAGGGGEVLFTATISNTGRGDTPQGTPISLVSRARASGQAPEIMPVMSQIDPIGAGGSAEREIRFTCPGVEGRTTYYVSAEVNPDHERAIRETVYTDNAYPTGFVVPPSFVCVPSANLVARAGDPLASPQRTYAGQNVRISGIVSNAGHADAGATHARAEFEASAQGAPSIAPQSVEVRALGVGEEATVAFDATCPQVEGDIAYTVRIRADSENEVQESGEGDNVFLGQYAFTCTAPTPNLVVVAGTPFVNPQSAHSGESVSVKAIVTNVGGGAAGASVLSAAPSAVQQGRPAIDSQSIDVAGIAAGGQVEKEIVFRCPQVASPSAYTVNIGADAGNRIQESNENDNAIRQVAQFTCTPPAQGGAGFGEVCGSAGMGQNVSLSFLALLATALVVAAAYMMGKAVESPRITNWCKIEVWQMLATAAIVVGVYCALALFCISTPAQLLEFTGASARYDLGSFSGYEDFGIYGASHIYLERLASYSKGVMTGIRYNIGVYELRSGIQEFECNAFCLLASQGTSLAPHGGESSYISVLTSSLQVSTLVLLSVLFQLFLLAYIQNGLFLFFLPVAIVVRSLPFMRGFGGALIALVVCLYILYPLMIYVDGVVFAPASKEIAPLLKNRISPGDGSIYPLLGNVRNGGSAEDMLTQNAFSMGEGRETDDMPSLIMLTSLIFMAGVFAPALNFVVIAAAAREISRMFGEEIDISRLGQML